MDGVLLRAGGYLRAIQKSGNGYNLSKFSLRYNAHALVGSQSGGLVYQPIQLRYNLAGLYGSVAKMVLPKPMLRKDIMYGGRFTISGHIREMGVLSKNRLVLLDRWSWIPVRSCVSNEAGEYAFENLNNTTEFIRLAVDDEGVFQAKAFDFLKAT
jgi:hypothetical protein